MEDSYYYKDNTNNQEGSVSEYAAVDYSVTSSETPETSLVVEEEETETISPIGHYDQDKLDTLIIESFPGKIVRKDLTSLMKRSANVPTFVLEYLLGMYCTTDDEELVREGVERIRRILVENYVRPDESERIKSKIRELGQYTIIDKISARLDERDDYYVSQFTNLHIEPFIIPDEYPIKYSKILMGGIWSIMRLEYQRPETDDQDALADIFDDDFEPKPKKKKTKKKNDPAESRFSVLSLNPIQMPNLDLNSILSQRKNFTVDEWIGMLLRSAGYEPDSMTERERMHFIERMVPLIERNYNLCELGPRGTGKSHIYKEVSPNSILLSGGQTTTANLFGYMNAYSRRSGTDVGLVGLWDCVTFDEVAGMRFKDQNAVQVMKDYMASGSYARGRNQVNADASMVFEGNINDTVQNVLKTTHLFDPFPPEFNNDSAFFDRIHYYLPGWEIPKMRSDLLTNRYGLITDCLSEFCHEMRSRDYSHHIDRFFRLNSDFNKRDEIAVRKTFSGLAKLLFPDEEMTKEDVGMLLDYAIEGRRRVKEQLKIMAGVEFIDVNLGYYDIDNPQDVHIIYVPEQTEDSLIPEASPMPGHVFSVGMSKTGEYAVYKLENKAVTGDFKFQTEGIGNARPVRESMDAAFRYFESNAHKVAAGMHIMDKDYLLFFRDMQSKGLSDECSLAEFVGLCSAACNRPVTGATVVPGTLRMSGTLDELKGLEDIMRVAKNAGAKKILLPMSSIQDLQSVPNELLESLSPDFYQDGNAVAAAKKALGL
ncbi:protease Lon-related BREX system protein BrxL [Anaerotardibacter muris]|uniref:protease Lon-related BREX system protein BrxL n=1 Tax=Anaerotardibacter muris TaxID=2941505 RepID=UPI00203FF05B|nr:protease Lon-related BREX system protein BrxL [Anaerotardibacter muris]